MLPLSWTLRSTMRACVVCSQTASAHSQLTPSPLLCVGGDVSIIPQGGSQAQHAAFVAALLKNVYNGDEANQPWAELMARYLIRWVHHCRCRLLSDWGSS